MRNKIVLTSNVDAAQNAVAKLRERGQGEEGMGLFWGEPGEGKSTTVAWLADRHDAVYVRASVTWSMTTMLHALCRELELEPLRQRAPMLENIVAALASEPRPIFIDEADYLFSETALLDAVRDVYDLAQVPVVLIAMEEARKKLSSRRNLVRFKRRVTQWVHFQGLSFEDAAQVADQLCEVQLGEKLLRRLYDESKGNIGRIVIGLSKIETFGRANSKMIVTLTDYGRRHLLN